MIDDVVLAIGIYMGRFSPIHIGHEAVIEKMLEKYGEVRSLILIGSINNPISARHLFSYKERRDFIKTLYPNLDIIPLPDHDSDEEWLAMLRDILRSFTFHDKSIEFFAGSKEDVQFLIDNGFKCTIIDRYDGTTPPISATQVRNALANNESLDGLVNPKLHDLIRSTHKVRWQQYQDKLQEIVNLLKTND